MHDIQAFTVLKLYGVVAVARPTIMPSYSNVKWANRIQNKAVLTTRGKNKDENKQNQTTYKQSTGSKQTQNYVVIL